MYLKLTRLLVFSMLFLTIFSCRKKFDGNAQIKLVMEHEFNNQDFRADTITVYNLSEGVEVTFINFKYYFSNIKLKDDKGTWWSDPDSYYIIDATVSKPAIQLQIPPGKYIEISYTIGVDSLRNFSGAQGGALSPSNGMFWSWQTGYIHMISEGQSPQIDRPNKNFIHHLGGFLDPFNIVKVITSTMPKPLIIEDDTPQEILMGIDVSKLYDNESNTFSIPDITNIHTPGENAFKLSQNFPTMFWVKDVIK
ncbi:hypothetical protein BH23THE1_BH23THE1_11470 [soil metagenome]